MGELGRRGELEHDPRHAGEEGQRVHGLVGPGPAKAPSECPHRAQVLDPKGTQVLRVWPQVSGLHQQCHLLPLLPLLLHRPRLARLGASVREGAIFLPELSKKDVHVICTA
jgi:hypothetical protein